MVTHACNCRGFPSYITRKTSNTGMDYAVRPTVSSVSLHLVLQDIGALRFVWVDGWSSKILKLQLPVTLNNWRTCLFIICSFVTCQNDHDLESGTKLLRSTVKQDLTDNNCSLEWGNLGIKYEHYIAKSICPPIRISIVKYFNNVEVFGNSSHKALGQKVASFLQSRGIGMD